MRIYVYVDIYIYEYKLLKKSWKVKNVCETLETFKQKRLHMLMYAHTYIHLCMFVVMCMYFDSGKQL